MADTFTLRERVAAFLRQHPNRWIVATSFESVGGRQGWRTRLSDCRRLGMQIENRVRMVRLEDGSSYKLSEYRYVPPSEPVEQRLPLSESVSVG